MAISSIAFQTHCQIVIRSCSTTFLCCSAVTLNERILHTFTATKMFCLINFYHNHNVPFSLFDLKKTNSVGIVSVKKFTQKKEKKKNVNKRGKPIRSPIFAYMVVHLPNAY